MINDLLIYSVVSFLLFFITSKISYKLNLVDIPNKRKKHLKPTANTGGLALSVLYLFAIKFFYVASTELNLLLAISFLISVVGFIDDKYHLNIGGKLSLQIIPTLYLIIFGKIYLVSLGTYYNISLELNTFAVPFTILCILFLINSFNYFDGIDGTLSLTALSVILILFFLISIEDNKLFLITIIIPIFIFLLFNFSLFNLPKLFLGDSGSLLIGFIISFKLIYLSNVENIHPILLAWSISIFVIEFLTINLIRIKNKTKLFKPNLDHLHHILFQRTKSKTYTNIIIFFLNILLFIIGYVSFILINQLVSLILYLVVFLIYFYFRNKYRNYKKLKSRKS